MKTKNIFKPLDKYEEEIIKDSENNEFIEVPNQKKNISKYLSYFKEMSKKEKRVTIRINKGDLDTIQEKAVRTGIPYQTIIASLLRQFAKGRVKISI